MSNNLEKSENSSKPVLALDITSIPRGVNLADVLKIYKDHNVIIWESYYGGVQPGFINRPEGYKHDVKYVDTSKMSKEEILEYVKSLY